jgi:molybdenum cofactor cytidylyltransferase
VVPQGIVAAGGRLSHFGLPVDPGNLLLLAELRGVPVIGVPSCARSLKRNGFDLVLERVMAGLTPGPLDLGAMGVGGLLSEIASRPSPRDAGGLRRQGHVAGLVLAAGQSRRMGRTKLLEPVAGAPLVRRVAEKLVGLGLAEVIVVTGHDAEGITAALAGLPLRLVHNEDYAQGLARSLRTGIAALGPEVTAALVCLGDMPRVAVEDMAALVQAGAGGRVAVPVRGGRRGNPVLWPAAHFAALTALTGDRGARGLLATLQDVVEVAASDDGIFTDIDTPDDLRSVRESGN